MARRPLEREQVSFDGGRRTTQLMHHSLGSRHHGGAILIKRAVVGSRLPVAALAETLRRAAAQGQTHRVPDHLRQEEVDMLSFELDKEGVFHMVPSALQGSRGGRGIVSIDVEAELRLLEGGSPTEPARIDVVVSPTVGTWVGLITPPLAFVVLGVIQLFLQPPSTGGFWLLLSFAGVLALIGWLRARSVVARAWPGLMVEVERLAEGTLFVPAA